MLLKRRFLWIFLASVFLTGCLSHSTKQSKGISASELFAVASQTQISPELLREELDMVKQYILTVHPEPFSRIDEASFNRQFFQIRQSLQLPLTRSQFFMRIAPLVANLRDIHSEIKLPKDKFGDISQQNERLFPLAVVIIQDKVYVAADLSDEPSTPSGAELLMINGAPIEHLLSKMREITVMETVTGQNKRIQLDFAWMLAAMGLSTQEYQVVHTFQGQKQHEKKAGLYVPMADSEKELNNRPRAYYDYSKLTATTSLLWFNDFNENPEVFDAFLNKTFKALVEQNVRNLIIDVRYNQGGLTENLKNLLSRISGNPIYWASKGHLKVSEPMQRNHRRKTKARRKNKYTWGLQWIPLEWTDKLQHSVWWSDPGEVITLDLEPIEPSQIFQPLNISVLTNGYCYSACSFFVAAVNYYGLATTYGEQTGSFSDYQFVYPVSTTLPHSGLVLALPTMRLDFIEQNQWYTLPKVPISRNKEDVSRRIDPVLNKALRAMEVISPSE